LALGALAAGCGKKSSERSGKGKSKAKNNPLFETTEGKRGGMRLRVSAEDSRLADDLLAGAKRAWFAGKYGKAIRLATVANALKPLRKHVAIIGLSACQLGRRKKARWAVDQLSGKQRGALLRACASRGIDLRLVPTTASAPVIEPIMAPVVAPPPVMGSGIAEEPPVDPTSAKSLYGAAKRAWLSGQCAKAIRFAKKANRLRFSRKHVTIIGACACSLGKRGQAKWAYKILRGGQRNMLLQVCKAKGIDLP